MKKTNNKEGFTLAELLIVVAIIAVLAAIAVPLFVGALSDAETRVKEANQRAVKGIAIAEILGKEEYRNLTEGSEQVQANMWTITAKVDMTGNVTEIKIAAAHEKDTSKVKANNGTCKKVAKADGIAEHYEIENMVLTQFEITNATPKTTSL